MLAYPFSFWSSCTHIHIIPIPFIPTDLPPNEEMEEEWGFKKSKALLEVVICLLISYLFSLFGHLVQIQNHLNSYPTSMIYHFSTHLTNDSIGTKDLRTHPFTSRRSFTFLCHSISLFTKQHHRLPRPLPGPYWSIHKPSIQHSFLILTLFGVD